MEMWKPVVGYNEYYLVNNYGVIKRGVSDKRNHKQKVLKIGVNPSGYHWLCLFDGRKYKKEYVHRIVLKAFYGDIPKGKQVNHKDGVKSNNSIDNLECVTPMENIHHAIKLGLRKNCKGGSEWKYKTSYKK